MRSPVESSLVCERTAQRFRLNMSVHLTKLASDYIESQHRLQDPEAHHSHIRRLEPSRLCGSLGHHVLHPLPGPAQLRSAQARHEHGSFPPVPCKLEGFLLTESFKHLGQMQMHIKWHIYQCSADFGFVVRLELPFFVVFVFSYALLLQELKNRSPQRFQVKNDI